jgi:Flp pilus assembly protein TadG
MRHGNKLWSSARFREAAASTSGNAAIEFALAVPVLVIAVLGLYDVASIAIGAAEMETAVRASTQYAMNGGTDMTKAQTLGVSAWNGKPSGGTLTVSTACTCGSSAGTCGTLCPDTSVPQTWVTATAQAPLGTNFIKINDTVTQKIQTR